jgi:Kef-type K+ transport system membrane component KefB
LVISGVVYLFFGVSAKAAVLIGPALALSSTAFVLQILIEKKQLNSSYGRASFAVLLMQDLAVVPLLALVPLLGMKQMTISEDIGLALVESLLILIAVVVAGRYLLHPILHRVAESKNSETFTASALLIVLGTAVATEHAGFSMAMGAFIAGLLISDSSYRHQIVAEILPFRGLLLGLFFISMGMSFNLALLIENPLRAIWLVLLLMGIKIMVLFHLTWLFGLSRSNSLSVAVILAQSGEFALVLFALAFQSQLISVELFQELLLVVLISMITTPLLARFAQAIFIRQKHHEQQNLSQNSVEDGSEVPIVIAGFGRVGRRIGEILSKSGIAYVALDSNPELVERERNKKHPVYYGDVCNPEVMKAAGASHAQIIIITLNEPESTEKVVISLRNSHPQIAIYARGYSLKECKALYAIGSAGVISETVEASIALSRMALEKIGVDEVKREALLHEYRSIYESQIKQV